MERVNSRRINQLKAALFAKDQNTELLCFVIFLFSICIGGIWNCTDHDCPGICVSLFFSVLSEHKR